MIFRPFRFCLTYVASLILIFLAAVGAGVGFGSDIWLAGLLSGPVLFAALREGARFAVRQSVVPSAAALWRAAMQMAFLTGGSILLVLAVGARLMPDLAYAIASLSPLALAATLVAGFVITVLVARFGFSMGARRRATAVQASA